MLRLLLDTRVLLWPLTGNARLSAATRAVMADTGNEVFVSAATFWEIAIKRALGRLQVPDNLIAEIALAGLKELPVTFSHGELMAQLPLIHRDPFDRMLVAQAQAESLVLVTADPALRRYDVATIAA